MRKIVKSITPPLVFDLLKYAYVRIKRKNTHNELSWQRATAGPLISRELFIEESPMGSAMLTGTYDIRLFNSAAEILSQSEIVIDIGAHIGYHSLCFAAISPKCKVISYEPAPVNLNLLKAILERNTDLKERIEVKSFAVGARKGTLEMMVSSDMSSIKSSMCFLSPQSEKIHVKRSRDYAGFKEIQVHVVSLDQETAGLNGRVGLVKIDVEGSEVEVIMGGREFLMKHRPSLFIEVHSAALAVQLTSALIELEYAVQIIDDQSRNRCVIRANPIR